MVWPLSNPHRGKYAPDKLNKKGRIYLKLLQQGERLNSIQLKQKVGMF